MLDWEKFKNSLTHKNIAVFGLGKSGLSTVKACLSAGLSVSVWDDNESQQKIAVDFGATLKELTKSDLSKFDLLILAPGIHYTFEPHDVVLNAQKHNLKIIGDVELLHLVGIPCATIGITGTNGKSTTTALMNHILQENGKKAIMAGNIGIPVFDVDFNGDLDFLVLELSSYQLDLCPSFRPDYSILLNISSDHLDRHGSMDAYVESKAKILEGRGVAVIDVDDDFTQKLFEQNFCTGQRNYVPVSIKHQVPEGYFVKDDNLYFNHQGEDREIGSLRGLRTLKGLHNYQNITCCYVVCKRLGLGTDGILASLKNFPGLPHRQYLITQKENVTFVNDSKATNGEAAAKALSAYNDIFWIIGGRPKKGGLQGLEIFKGKIVKSYVIGEAKEEFSQWLDDHGFVYELYDDLAEATHVAYKEASQFDLEATVLLSPACASWDQFKSFEERGNRFVKTVEEITQ